ncbi:TRAP transporter small permease [Loktanella sp. Alg231-35]|uniref:TRAP transporter small permease n=1 Tax=Loktanella sp. Alg231-35 TaxID=1922220 RepID=UPI000D55DBAD|nr:TRAP transporter small permease [Loktanella sp. Alg231-35]
MEPKHSKADPIEKLGPMLAAVGAVIVVIQTVWVSYGVVMRYVFNKPDQIVTEATALMLVPCAFLGLAYAMQQDALPKVTMIVDQFPRKAKRVLGLLNQLIMLLVGGFFAYSAVSAFFRANKSGAASEVLSWPRAWFWAPTALALIVFCIVLAGKIWITFSGKSDPHSHQER